MEIFENNIFTHSFVIYSQTRKRKPKGSKNSNSNADGITTAAAKMAANDARKGKHTRIDLPNGHCD